VTDDVLFLSGDRAGGLRGDAVARVVIHAAKEAHT
jgi:hypothetical protein